MVLKNKTSKGILTMVNNWRNIWNKKAIVTKEYSGNEFERFCELKKANGFDVAVGDEHTYYSSFYSSWLSFYNRVVDLIGEDIHSVYEVGCGSGVNLFMFKSRLPKAVFGGCDYSDAMVNSAKISTGSCDFVSCGADEISVKTKFDVVMSESVFQYFESEQYAEKVLRKMIEKTNKLTYLGEIHNKVYENELMEYRRKTIQNYEERYKGLNKLFLHKEWVEDIAKDYGKKVLFTEVDNPEYLNGKYEFNCFIY